MASFIKRALEYMTGDDFETTEDFFTDDENSQPHEPNINAVAAEGIAVGNGQDTYNPFQNVSRGQMAGFLTRTLDVLFQDGDIRAIGDEDEQPGEEPELTFDGQAVAGEELEFTITGDVASVSFSGDCIDDTEVTEDADEDTDGFQGSVQILEDADAEDCVISFVITDDEGNTFEGEETVEVEEPAQNQVTLTSQDVQQGGTVTGTISGDAASATVSGCGLTNEPVQDTNATTAGIQFSETIPANQAVGSCTLTFTITKADGTTVTETETVNVTARPAGQSATTRPELVSATIVGTVLPGNATPSNPAGTTVSYTFDENIVAVLANGAGNGTNNGVDINDFNVYDANGNNVSGTREFVSASGNTVTIRFTGLNATTGTGQNNASLLTLATVDFQAVFDSTGQGNPEGDAPIGTAGGGTNTLPAGITNAPTWSRSATSARRPRPVRRRSTSSSTRRPSSRAAPRSTTSAWSSRTVATSLRPRSRRPAAAPPPTPAAAPSPAATGRRPSRSSS
jgi:hypothetical protein